MQLLFCYVTVNLLELAKVMLLLLQFLTVFVSVVLLEVHVAGSTVAVFVDVVCHAVVAVVLT